MFWGLILRANKRYSQTVSKSFHLSQACLDLSQTPDDKDVQVQVHLTSENENYILCTLDRKNNLQARLDLVFSEGDDIAFSCLGGSVHLTGYLVPFEEHFGFGGEDDEESDLENETPVPEIKSKKPKKEIAKQVAADDSDDSDDGDFNLESNGLGSEDDVGDSSSGSELDEDEEDGEEEEDDDDDESEEEQIVEPPPKKSKHQNGIANGKAEKKQKDGKKEAASVKPGKPVKEQKPTVESATKILSGGLKVEEIRVGKGPEAKPGKKVQVYYEGRLQSNNKIFDSTKSGQGFQFQLGRGEVIRGWDLGVAGMKVGSKRRITCPPGLAYGVKGSPPVIPGNATLVFDVELRNVK